VVKRALVYVGVWLGAVAVATGIALAAVGAVGDAARGRGPLGAAVAPLQDSDPDPSDIPSDLPGRTRDIQGEYGTFRVSCEGPFASGLDVSANQAAGWSVLSYEKGPDDDVDAVFTQPGRSVEVEVYCNQGVPTVGDVERAEFLDED
jgi:hypothetical protein